MRIPVVLQNEATECGIACLTMVAEAFGDHRGLAAMRGHSSMRGTSLDQLIERAEALGFEARALRIELDDLRALNAPAILHWDLRHFVVLVSASRRGIVINDPACGQRRMRWNEVSRHFTGVALEIWPTDAFKPVATAPKINWRRLLGPMPGLASATARILALAIVLELMLLASPFFMQGVIDHVLVGRDAELLTVLATAFGGLLVLQALISALRAWSVTALTSLLGVRWQGRLFKHLLSLPLAYFEKRHLGEVLSRFGSLQNIQRTVGGSFVEAIMDGLMATLTLTFMFLYSGLLAGVTLVAVVAYLGLRAMFFNVIRDGTERQIVAAAAQQSHAVETIRGVQSLKLLGGETRRLSNWRDLMVNAINEQLTLERYGVGFRVLSSLMIGVERIAVVWLGANMVLRQEFSVGMLIAYLAYRDQFAGRAGGLVDRFMELRLLRVHAERIADITETPAEAQSGGIGVGAINTIEARNLRFRYGEGEPWIIRDLDLRIARGETVAIVGPSGCGKTTLIKLLLGLLDPAEGHIEVDGHKLRALDLGQFRRLCGSVMQDDQLFAGSIGDNIACFEQCADSERVAEVAAMAAIDRDIASMPMGYDTRVGDMGTSLSGGQKQRVLLARALYRNPQLLLLDEATSHLDVASERLVNQSIRGLPIARIVIAHRPETIASADRVLVMESGRIVREYRPDRKASDPVDSVTNLCTQFST
jgi:ATP-binding cassette, subfamily B, bacterial CvaB/MchF/RaxB